MADRTTGGDIMKTAMTMLAATALALPAGPSLALANQASAVQSGAALDRAFVIGRWGPDAACSQVVEFHADGRVTPPDGASWSLTGNRLTMTIPGRPTVTTTRTRLGGNMTATRLDGTTFTMFRCR